MPARMILALILVTLVLPAFAQDDIDQLRLKADQGDASAQFNLGVMYTNGEGVPQDDKEAVRWFRFAADQGDASAQFNLGFSYGQGKGILQDNKEAVRWFLAAADQGFAKAQLGLGVMYGNGQGVPQDYSQAHIWFNLAASDLIGEDRERAVRNRDRVAKEMTSEQIAEAQRLAREWKPKTGGQ